MNPYVTRPSSIVFGTVVGGLTCTAVGLNPFWSFAGAFIGAMIGAFIIEVVDCFKR